MNKVYLVMEYSYNGEHYEDFEDQDTPIRAFESKEEAEEFIKLMPIPVKELRYDEQRRSLECEELVKKDNNRWKRKGDTYYEVLWDVEGAIRAFVLRNKYGDDQCYAYYILEVPFGKEEKDPYSERILGHCKDCKYFGYHSIAKLYRIPVIVEHEICTKWGDCCKTREDGYCHMFEPQEKK